VFELDGTPRGTVVAVQANPASDLLVIDDGNLVPLRFVVDRAPQRLIIDAPAGLFD
jgi:16S rRNA processing protein RimM